MCEGVLDPTNDPTAMCVRVVMTMVVVVVVIVVMVVRVVGTVVAVSTTARGIPIEPRHVHGCVLSPVMCEPSG